MNRLNPKTIKMIKVLCCILTVAVSAAWLGFIFSNSLKDSVESGNQSDQVHTVVNQIAQSVGVKQEITHESIRNTAHFVEFSVLGLLVCLCVASFGWLFGKGSLMRLALLSPVAVPFCFLMAVCDELLQKNSPGRACQFSDMMIDTAGAALATLCFVLLLLLMAKIQKNAKKEKT